MLPDYWLKQDPASPLFPDILWSRPENRATAGKLLIIGGEKTAFAAPAQGYQAAIAAGIGTARVILPECLRKTLGGVLENCDFAPCTPSGSFAMLGLMEWQANAQWSDGVLLAGDFGQNSETTILLEKFANNFGGPLVLTGDTVDHFLPHPLSLLDRPQTVVAGSLKQLQRLAIGASSLAPIYQRIDLMQLVESLHKFSAEHAATIITVLDSTLCIASQGRVSTTAFPESAAPDLLSAASTAAVYLLQNQTKEFEAMTAGIATLARR